MTEVLARSRRRRQPHRGQALVEFALLLVPLMFLLLGAVDLGRVFFAQITISNAARAGAMQAAITPASDAGADCTSANYSSNLIVCAVQNETGQRGASSTSIVIPASAITVSCQDASGAPTACPAAPLLGTRASVAVTARFNLLTPMLQAVLGSSTVRLSSTAIADQQQLPSPVVPTPAASASPSSSPCAKKNGKCP